MSAMNIEDKHESHNHTDIPTVYRLHGLLSMDHCVVSKFCIINLHYCGIDMHAEEIIDLRIIWTKWGITLKTFKVSGAPGVI